MRWPQRGSCLDLPQCLSNPREPGRPGAPNVGGEHESSAFLISASRCCFFSPIWLKRRSSLPETTVRRQARLSQKHLSIGTLTGTKLRNAQLQGAAFCTETGVPARGGEGPMGCCSVAGCWNLLEGDLAACLKAPIVSYPVVVLLRCLSG
uniref:Uncharacterized protein n=1 Tax=Myotis myotis TaxID=51298 RepID=A0A7J7ZYJ7_MYOMY|nr:hypothetical protein mMyoMyo1_010008 [Myotis myotis]